jgi:dTDP-4-amino-4,6-dideoxygalactose transaminase
MATHKNQKRIFLSPPHLAGTELDFIQQALYNNYIAPCGPMLDAFETEICKYTGFKHCVAVSSGTAAIHVALRLLGVKAGDEVFASTLTFIGGVSPILFQGGTPVFIDSDRSSWTMDTELLDEEMKKCARVGKLPKAVLPTDIYGQCCDLPAIVDICERYGVPVICDSAEALGTRFREDKKARKIEVRKLKSSEDHEMAGLSDIRTIRACGWQHAGSGATAAVFSFNGNKIITTSSGGVLASDDPELIQNALFLAQQAKDAYSYYEHTTFGYNYRMSQILAAIGLGQLQVLEERVNRKREIFDYYLNALGNTPGIEFMPESGVSRCNRWLTVILITPSMFGADRETVRLALEEQNIESRPVWKPMHLQPVFKFGNMQRWTKGQINEKLFNRVVGGEVAEDLFKRGLCLPSGTAMTNSDLDRVIDIVLRYRKKR